MRHCEHLLGIVLTSILMAFNLKCMLKMMMVAIM